MKILFGIFEGNMNYATSILGNLAFELGWEVDCCYYSPNISEDEIDNSLSKVKPDLVALSFMLFGRPQAFRAAKVARDRGIKVVAGGIHPSTCPDDLIRSGYFDSIVVGDGMGVFEDILRSYKHLEGEKISGKRHPDIRKYVQRYFTENQILQIKNIKSFDINTSFGCPYNCYFCSSNVSIKYFKLPVSLVVEELKKAEDQFGIKRVVILDETFTSSASRIRDFRRQLEKGNMRFSYSANTRLNCFNEKIAEELKMVGVEDLYFGLETASPRLLEFLNKKITVEDAYRARELCRKYQFPFRLYLMVGLPTQDESDYEVTLEFVKQTQPQAVSIYYFVPFPKTHLYDYCLKNKYIPENSSFECYLGLDTGSERFKGYRETQGFLNKIDYEMAGYYKSEMEKIVDSTKEKNIMEGVNRAGKKKWILFGTGIYFYTVMEKISKYNLHNFLGYYDYDEKGFKGKTYYYNVQKYDYSKRAEKPEIIVVTTHKESKLYTDVIYPLIRNTFDFTGKIISVSNY